MTKFLQANTHFKNSSLNQRTKQHLQVKLLYGKIIIYTFFSSSNSKYVEYCFREHLFS